MLLRGVGRGMDDFNQELCVVAEFLAAELRGALPHSKVLVFKYTTIAEIMIYNSLNEYVCKIILGTQYVFFRSFSWEYCDPALVGVVVQAITDIVNMNLVVRRDYCGGPLE